VYDCSDYTEPMSLTPGISDQDWVLYLAHIKYQYDNYYECEGKLFSADDYRKVLETGVDNTPFEARYCRPRKIVINSGEICVLQPYSLLGVDAQHTTGDFIKAGYGNLRIGSALGIYYERDENGDVILDADGLAYPQVYYQDANVFDGLFGVGSGTVEVYGANTFNGEVVVGIGYDEYAEAFQVQSSLTVNGSGTRFNGEVLLNSGKLVAGSYYYEGRGVTFEKDVTVVGDEKASGNLFVYGAAKFNGNLSLYNLYEDDFIKNSTVAFFRSDLSGGRAVFADDSILTLGFNTQACGEAECLNVDFNAQGGFLTYSNSDAELETFDNVLYVTYDENETPTYLEWQAARKCVEDPLSGAIACGRVLNRDAGGYGVVSFTSYNQRTDELTTDVNGYSVVIDGGDRSRYWGETLVSSAMLVLKGGTSYGVVVDSDLDHFIVDGESYIPVNTDPETGLTTWNVRSCGVLGFYRGDETDPNVAPTINANVIGLYDGCSFGAENAVLGGARLWLDAGPAGEDASSNRALGTFNANTIQLREKTKVWYDRISTPENGAIGSLVLNANKIEIVNSVYDAELDVEKHEVLREATSEDIESIFGGAQLVDLKYDASTGTITVGAKSAKDFANAEGLSAKEREYAVILDANRLAINADTPFYDALYNETDNAKVRQTIHNLSIGGYRMLNSYGHFGNPTSSFFGGSIISGEHKRAQDVHDEYDGPARLEEQESAIAKDEEVESRNRTIWGAYTNTFVKGNEYEVDGVSTDGYRFQRHGIVGGVTRQLDDSTTCGLFFGLLNPELSSRGEFQGDYGSYGSRMKMNDFQFAGHFEKIVGDFWEIVLYVGGGTQAMDWRRDLYLAEGGRYCFTADGTGNTMTGTAYLSNRIDLTESATFRPTIGIDSEHSWIFGFNENQTVGGAVDDVNAYMRQFAQTYSYDQTYFNRNMARAGARFNWDGKAGFAGVNAQAFYAVKLGGKDAPLVSYRSANYSFENMETHMMGNESFSVGGGGFLNLNREKTLTTTADFNAVWYKNATTQNVTGALSYRF